MDKYGYEGDPKFKPLSPWAYLGYGVLFVIPFVGVILIIIFSFIDGNVNRKNYARSYFCALAILIGILIAMTLIMGPDVMMSIFEEEM